MTVETTNCINGELKPGDLVLSTHNDDYALLVGTVLSINKVGTPEHDAETENETDDVHVNFMDSDYSDRRIAEIENMFSDLYSEPKEFGDCPIDDTIMAPEALIRITGIDLDVLTEILDSEEGAAAFCRRALAEREDTEQAFAKRLGITTVRSERQPRNIAPEQKGYVVAESDGDGYIPGALHIERDDSLFIYPNDIAAARAAEADGVKLIYGLPYIPDGMYIDTPENRSVIERVSESARLAMPAEKPLRRQLEERLDANFALYKEEQLRELSKEGVFGAAAEIASVCNAHEYFRNEHAFTTGQAEFLLKFQNPLEVVSDRWSDGMDAANTVRAIFSEPERTLQNGGYGLAPDAPESAEREPLIQRREDGKTSVLDTLRRARENHAEHAPKPEQPERTKPGHDL
jgi:hypothetical protein